LLVSIAQPLAITLDDIDLSLISALIGLAVTLPVTYLIVDRVVARHDRKKLEPVEKLAKERLRSKLGVGFLTTFLITLVIDVTSAVGDKKGLSKDVISLHIEKLKGAQSDLEMLLGVYNNVLDVRTTHLTSSIILFIEHLQEDFEYLSQIYPKPPTRVHASHIEDVILKTVKLTKEELEVLGTDSAQIRALEQWLTEYTRNRVAPSEPREMTEVSGKHLVG
jgi:tetrahydromethanopterin S-methyltransferase subunit B